MDADILKNLTDPAILFFFLGVTIGLIRSNLEIPAPIAKFLSLYLLMALGFKGGQALADAGLWRWRKGHWGGDRPRPRHPGDLVLGPAQAHRRIRRCSNRCHLRIC